MMIVLYCHQLHIATWEYAVHVRVSIEQLACHQRIIEHHFQVHSQVLMLDMQGSLPTYLLCLGSEDVVE